MSQFLDKLKANLDGKNVRVVFPEGVDLRILTAAIELNRTSYVHPIVLGNENEIIELAEKESLDIENLEIINPVDCKDKEELVDAFVERRNGKVTKSRLKKF